MSSDKNFWLITIQAHWLVVALVSCENNQYQIKTIGPKVVKEWDNDQNLITAIDASLSSAANEIGLPTESEPSKAAFILPPFWVGSDGKIVEVRLKQIEAVCKTLDFTPLGFISDDEAIVEHANVQEGLPVSFVLVNLSPQEIITSLVYLGKIKARVTRSVPQIGFDPVLIQESLAHLDNDNGALPPQIMVFGDYNAAWINSLKNYNWIGNKTVSTFLHMPDVTPIDFGSLFDIFTQVIVSQIDLTPNLNNYQTIEVIPDSDNVNIPLDTVAAGPEDMSKPAEDSNPQTTTATDTATATLSEIDAVTLGFGNIAQDTPTHTPPPDIPLLTQVPQNLDQYVDSLTPSTLPQPSPLKTPPKIKLPRFRPLRLTNRLYPLMGILFTILLVLIIPIFISTAEIILYLTPYTYQKTVNVTLDSQLSEFDSSKLHIPVTKRNFDVTVSSSIATTGKKTTGEKSKGEVVIFNKQDKPVSIAKGSIITDSSGHKFELLTSTVVASSSADFQTGIITMGQTRTMVQAADIGDQYNIAKDSKLTFKDYTNSQLESRSTQAFTGGFSKEIAAVSDTDKKSLETKLSQEITTSIDQKLSNEVQTLSGAIKDTIKTQKNRIDYSREIGEESTDLSATQKATVSVLVVNAQNNQEVIEAVLKNEEGFIDSDYDPSDFNFQFKISKTEDSKASGQLTVTGHATPKIDIDSLKKSLTLKTLPQTRLLLKKNVKRVYDYQINQKLAGFIKVLPSNPSQITIEVKSKE